MGCHDTYISGRQLLNLTEHKKRDDTYEKFWSSIFVLPGNVSGFNQVNIFSLVFTTVKGLFQARWQGDGTPLYGQIFVFNKGKGINNGNKH